MSFSLAVFISGTGSNLNALIQHINEGQLKAKISVVVSDHEDAAGLAYAKQAQIPFLTLPQGLKRQEFDAQLIQSLSGFDFDLVVLAGFMRILGADFIQYVGGRIINIHPSLLPKYPGLNTYQKVLSSEDRYHGCTIHWVTAKLDAGPIIQQVSFAIEATDDLSSLKRKTQALEHQTYWQAIELIRLKKSLPPLVD